MLGEWCNPNCLWVGFYSAIGVLLLIVLGIIFLKNRYGDPNG